MHKIEHSAFISDLHLNDFHYNRSGERRGVILYERTEFKTMDEHDRFMHDALVAWAKLHQGWNLFILGDFGDVRKTVDLVCELQWDYDIYVVGVAGNHETMDAKVAYSNCFYEWHDYPFYISKRVMLSHEPRYPMPFGELNIHGHLHGSKLDSKQHMCVSAKVCGYQPVTWKAVTKWLGNLVPASYKFLQEPYKRRYILTQPNDNAIAMHGQRTGYIDFPKSLEIYQMNKINHTKS